MATTTRRQQTCFIPIRAPALNSTSQGQIDFFHYVNGEWLKSVKIPAFENDFGVSEEVERCIYEKAKRLILSIYNTPENKCSKEELLIKQLTNSALVSRLQNNSVQYLKQILTTLNCLKTPSDIFREFAKLSRSRINSLFLFTITKDKEEKNQILIEPQSPSLPTFYYTSDKKDKYISLLHKLGKEFDLDSLPNIYKYEKYLANKIDILWSSDKHKITGAELQRKFPGLDWSVWFEEHNMSDWKDQTFFYNSYRGFSHIQRILSEWPLSVWKTYLARTYILNAIPFLPPPFDELDYSFFGKTAEGQKQKMPQMELLIRTIYSYCGTFFSKLFWNFKEVKDIPLCNELQNFMTTLLQSAQNRMKEIEWLEPKTREAGVKKIASMKSDICIPKTWNSPILPESLDETNFLKNIYTLGNIATQNMFGQIGKKGFEWDDGIYYVNAFYFNEMNHIVIPYGTTLPPFYRKGKDAWNYGALGAIIAHELCHGFDEDGRLYNEEGQKKTWWTHGDLVRYRKKAKGLISLFNRHGVNGERTLSENIADLGGVGIALDALKEWLDKKGVKEMPDILAAYREFFTAFAVSWRTIMRPEKYKKMLAVDVHAPAEFRVDLVVRQFDEFYSAFNIGSDVKGYIKPEDRIRIF